VVFFFNSSHFFEGAPFQLFSLILPRLVIYLLPLDLEEILSDPSSGQKVPLRWDCSPLFIFFFFSFFFPFLLARRGFRSRGNPVVQASGVIYMLGIS